MHQVPCNTLRQHKGGVRLDILGRRELRSIERIVCENPELLRNEWDEFCSGYIS